MTKPSHQRLNDFPRNLKANHSTADYSQPIILLIMTQKKTLLSTWQQGIKDFSSKGKPVISISNNVFLKKKKFKTSLTSRETCRNNKRASSRSTKEFSFYPSLQKFASWKDRLQDSYWKHLQFKSPQSSSSVLINLNQSIRLFLTFRWPMYHSQQYTSKSNFRKTLEKSLEAINSSDIQAFNSQTFLSWIWERPKKGYAE